MSGLGNLNPTSQPFFPIVGQRRESTPHALQRMTNDDHHQPPRRSSLAVGSDYQSEPPSYFNNLGAIGSPAMSGRNTPSRMKSGDGLGFRLSTGDHMRYPSALSAASNNSYASARSSPSPPDQQVVMGPIGSAIGLQRRDSHTQLLERRGSQTSLNQAHRQINPLQHQLSHLGHISPHVSSSLRSDLSDNSQLSRQHTPSMPLGMDDIGMNQHMDDPSGVMTSLQHEDTLPPLLRNVNADRSYPLVESRLRREASHVAQMGDGDGLGAGDLSSSAGSGSLSLFSPGTFGSPAPGVIGDGSLGRGIQPTDVIESIVPPALAQQKSFSQPQPPNITTRTMSLSVPIGRNSPSPHSAPVRKSSVASFTSQDYRMLQHQTQETRNPLPNSFLNYTISGGVDGSTTPAATATILAASRDNSNATTPNTSSTASIAGINPLEITTPTSNGPNDGSSGGGPGHPGDNTSALAISASPSSSVRSSSAFDRGESPAGLGQSLTFESQAKSSPFLNDLLDRLIRCEYSTRDIHRELGDLSKKVDFLVNRILASDGMSLNSNNRKDSFSTSSPYTNGTSNGNGHTITSASHAGAGSLMGLQGAGSSTSSLLLPPGTPNNLREKDEEIRLLNQQINTLTSSVSQLLQIQNQAHIQSINAGLSPNVGYGTPGGNPLGSQMGTPNMNGNGPMGTPDLGQSPMLGPGGMRNDMAMGGNGRAAPRAPVPVRTWSSSSVEMNLGMPNVGPAGRDANGMNSPAVGMLRDKRRSVVGLTRRDSAGTGVDSPGADWGGNSPRENSGNSPNITKWEHLALTPELLRSIAKYGVGPPNKIQQRALPFLLRGSDIIAQAPPTQERIAAYVIPAINAALTLPVSKTNTHRGPVVVIISTTVDQATQAQRMIRDLGGPIGVRSALGVGVGGDVQQELRLLQQSMPHILCGTPQKLHSLFTANVGGMALTGSEVRFLVLDEVDQLIARNLHEFVFNIVKLFPPPRSRAAGPPTGLGALGTPTASPATLNPGFFSSFDANSPSTNGGPGTSPFPTPVRRFSSNLAPSPNPDQAGGANSNSNAVERQTALFSNTVPQDVLNLATTIQLREPVRVLVRRDGNVTHTDSSNSGSRGLRQFYLYLAFTAGANNRGDPNSEKGGAGLGIIGSGRGNGNVTNNPETAQAREWKLDALADLFDDIEISQGIVHVGGLTALDAVVYKLASRGLEAVPLHSDMNAGSKAAALTKFRGTGSTMVRQNATKVLVVYDVQVKAPDVFQVPLVVNYDLPKAVEEYAHRVAPAISTNYSRSGIVVNFVTATGGDVEMLRSIECFYKIKCPEVPMSLRDII